jgi:hypothetical protein
VTQFLDEAPKLRTIPARNDELRQIILQLMETSALLPAVVDTPGSSGPLE